jgi:hypothetical protein
VLRPLLALRVSVGRFRPHALRELQLGCPNYADSKGTNEGDCLVLNRFIHRPTDGRRAINPKDTERSARLSQGLVRWIMAGRGRLSLGLESAAIMAHFSRNSR